MSENTGWQWWSGRDEEWMEWGPFDSREQAIETARQDACGEFQDEDGVWRVYIALCEARQDPLRLADWIGADDLLESAEERLADSDRVASENDEGPWFKCTTEQEASLIYRIKMACDEWQKVHGIIFKSSTFSACRNTESVVMSHPNDDANKLESTEDASQ